MQHTLFPPPQRAMASSITPSLPSRSQIPTVDQQPINGRSTPAEMGACVIHLSATLYRRRRNRNPVMLISRPYITTSGLTTRYGCHTVRGFFFSLLARSPLEKASWLLVRLGCYGGCGSFIEERVRLGRRARRNRGLGRLSECLEVRSKYTKLSALVSASRTRVASKDINVHGMM